MRSGLMAPLAIMGLGLAHCKAARADDAPPVAVRAEMLTVTPATGPVTHVLVKNLSGLDFDGRLRVQFPSGWKVDKPSQAIHLMPGRVARLPVAIETGLNSPANSYPLVIEVVSAAGRVWTFRQSIVCASAPYLSIQVDGQTEDWKDSIPVTFGTDGHKTIIRTAYTRRQFFLLVGVEQKTHRPLLAAGGSPDAVQIALAPRDAVTPARTGETSPRFEFLLAEVAGGAGCFALTRPGETLPAEPVALEGRQSPLVKLKVFRKDGFTWYECSIPWKSLPGIEPEPGREFCLSLLVHDAESGRIRDWGEAAGLWASQRNRFAWVPWIGARWPAEPLLDSAIEWGFCSSAQ